MTTHQFRAAFKIAKDFSHDLTNIDNRHILGYGLRGFTPVYVTLEMIAKEIRWHALQMNGAFNGEMLNEVATYGKKSFLVI